jgi:hypothetical protein
MVTSVSGNSDCAVTHIVTHLDISVIDPIPSHLLTDIPDHDTRFELERPR